MKFKQLREKYRSKYPASLVAAAVKIAIDMGGNMTGAYKKIEAMKRGLADDPIVADALKQANESVNEGKEEYVMKKGTYTRKVDGKTADKMKRQGWKLVAKEEVNEDYNQDLKLATKNVARLAKKETGQDQKDYQAVSRALAQGNLGAVKKVIKGISTKEIQSDLLNILVGYNDLIAKLYPKAMSGGKFKSGMTVDKMIKEDEEVNERVTYPKTMKDIVRRYGKELKQAERTGNIDKYLSRDAEEALKHWVFKNEPYVGDDPDDFDEWLDDNLEDIVKGKIKEDVNEVVSPEEKAQLALKHAKELETLKKKHEREKENMKEDTHYLTRARGREIVSNFLENYRVLAKHGMGTETKKSIKVGTEIDYYRADGAKYMGKVTKMTPTTYIVKDTKNGKNYQFTYHDRIKAKELLKK